MSVLAKICSDKRNHVAHMKTQITLDDLKMRLNDTPHPQNFINALKTNEPNAIIAEIKQASPSKGIICDNFDPIHMAQIYLENGASCLSVLTDMPYFKGHDDHFNAIRLQSPLPMLRKDFMIDLYQIYESRAMGADCILIIMAALDDSLAKDMYDLATDLGMDCLVETHDAIEIERALKLNPRLIGVNNRNLKTLDVDLQASHNLIAHIPHHVFKISESGIRSAEDIEKLQATGYQGFLIGESLMSDSDAAKKLSTLVDTK